MVEGDPRMVYYNIPENRREELMRHLDAVADSDTKGANVLNANLSDSYFCITKDGYLESVRMRTDAVDFLVEFYDATAWGKEISHNSMRVDVG